MKARENPFATERLEQVSYRFLDESWDELLARLAVLNYRGAIVGPEGRGKTTLFEELQRRLAERGLHEIIFFDGIEKLSLLQWQRLKLRAQNAQGLIVTTHRRGRLPTLIECATTPELFRDVVEELLARDISGYDLEGIYWRHQGNMRLALLEMYDLVGAESSG